MITESFENTSKAVISPDKFDVAVAVAKKIMGLV